MKQDFNTSPPTWARKLLSRTCPSHLLEEVEGDLLEEFEYQLRKNGKKKAELDYVLSVIGFMSPFGRKKGKNEVSLLSTIMWKNYFITAIRNVSRNRTYSLINLTGLTLGLVCCMLIFQFVIYENSADKFHENFDQLHRVVFKVADGGATADVQAQISYGAGQSFKEEIPAVENFARIRADFFQEGPTASYTVNADRKIFKDIRSILVDPSFLEVFSFKLVKGDRAKALSSPQSVLITESTAKRFFGDEDPIGKTLDYRMISGRTPVVQHYQVAGVLKDPPANSHIQFEVILPLEILMSNSQDRVHELYESWILNEFTTYVTLKQDVNIAEVEKQMTAIADRYLGERMKRLGTTLAVQLQPMASVYFDRSTNLGIVGFGSAIMATRTGSKSMVYFFTVVAIITLAIALMSYVNLSTVRSLDRAKEVGIRKVIGAYKRNLIVQFLMESVLMNITGLAIAIVLVLVMLPHFNEFVKTDFTFTSWFNDKFLLLIGAIFLAGVLLSGLYPAFILSSFMPIKVLKGSIGSLGGRSRMRKFFIVLQYAPAISLLVCTLIVYQQLEYMRNKDVGLDMYRLITVRSPLMLPEGVATSSAESAFKKEVVKIPGVEYASYAGNQAGRGLNFLVPFTVDSVGDLGVRIIKCSGVDHDFIPTFGVKVIAGQPFTEGMTGNFGEGDNAARKVMANTTAIQMWGFKRNEDAIGRLITSADGNRYYIQAVMEDFSWASVHKAIDPVMFWYTPNNRFMTIRMKSDTDINEVISGIKKQYDQLFPMDVFHYEFADDVYKRQYGEDEKFAKLFGIFSVLSGIIASMGLFGLAAFSAERRSKEVGIRKVLGASVNSIVRLLGKEFVLLVFIAFLIGSPVAWFVMSAWLQTFAFHIPLNAIPFIMTGTGALLIAIATVSWRTVRVAVANPVKSLRDE